MKETDEIVFVIDDDESVRKSLKRLIQSVGFRVETFPSALEFLNRDSHSGPCCLVLDIRMPEMNGMDLQEVLKQMEQKDPIIFITGHGDVPMSVKAMKEGAVDFLQKPFEDTDLINAIRYALEKHKIEISEDSELESIRRRITTLSPREYQVFSMVVKGMLNKQVAFSLGISEKTVKVHRARAMEKMNVDSLAELVQLAVKAGITTSEQ